MPDERRWSDQKLEEFHEEFLEHRASFEAHDRDEREFRDKILAAFPGGDTTGHRRYHDELIAAAEEQKRFYAELRLGLAKNGIWAATILLLGLLLAGAVLKLKHLLGISP